MGLSGPRGLSGEEDRDHAARYAEGCQHRGIPSWRNENRQLRTGLRLLHGSCNDVVLEERHCLGDAMMAPVAKADKVIEDSQRVVGVGNLSLVGEGLAEEMSVEEVLVKERSVGEGRWGKFGGRVGSSVERSREGPREERGGWEFWNG